MRARKFLSFLLALSIVFAPFPGSMALAFAAAESAGAHAMAGCHEAMMAHVDALPSSHDGHDATLHARHNHGTKGSPQLQHDCCTGVVGLVSFVDFSPVVQNAQEAIPFRPSLRLVSNMTGIYHPPRQNA
ncbi:MAG: hypothetical protein LBT71_07060 [Azoarcus sp.]|jgi:hypothetical protein|nr:hypothetical protein [Azoarcus sp.]